MNRSVAIGDNNILLGLATNLAIWAFVLAVMFARAEAASMASNPVVPDGQLGEFRHGTYPSFGVGDGDWTHVGVDLSAPCGSQVYAFADGTVEDIIDSGNDGDFSDLGFMVLLRHPKPLLGKEFYTLYLHLQGPPAVRVGDDVRGGITVVGHVGATGKAFGCHTHFEARHFRKRLLPEWGNIYGRGNLRDSSVLTKYWIDPADLFQAHPGGLSTDELPKDTVGLSTESPLSKEFNEPPSSAAAAAERGETDARESDSQVALVESRPVDESLSKRRRDDALAIPPNDMLGVWSLPTCQNPNQTLLLNSVAVLGFSRRDGWLDDTVFLSRLEFTKDHQVRFLDANAQRGEPETVLFKGGRLVRAGLERTDVFVRCKRMPPNYYAFIGETIALFEATESILQVCNGVDGARCIETAFAFADVTSDGQLTPAEIARVLRALSFFLGYGLADAEDRNASIALADIYGVIVLANLTGPFFANSIIESSDFDGNGAVTLDELLQDRGGDHLAATIATASFASTDVAMKALVSGLMGALQVLPGLLGGL